MRIVAVVAVLLVLSGCARTPSDEAWSACVRGPSALWQLEHPEATVEEQTRQLVAAAERCSLLFDADPDLFEETYG